MEISIVRKILIVEMKETTMTLNPPIRLRDLN